MLLFQKLVDETQMPKPQEYTDIFILTKKLFLVGLRGLQSISNPVERPCNIFFIPNFPVFDLEAFLSLNKLKNSSTKYFQVCLISTHFSRQLIHMRYKFLLGIKVDPKSLF